MNKLFLFFLLLFSFLVSYHAKNKEDQVSPSSTVYYSLDNCTLFDFTANPYTIGGFYDRFLSILK